MTIAKRLFRSKNVPGKSALIVQVVEWISALCVLGSVKKSGQLSPGPRREQDIDARIQQQGIPRSRRKIHPFGEACLGLSKLSP